MIRRIGIGLALALAVAVCGCGGRPALVAAPIPDPRGGSAEEQEAAAWYASALEHAWSGRFRPALAQLKRADELAPDQPLILAAMGFVLDDLAHPEDADAQQPYYNGLPSQGVLRREELSEPAFTYLNRAAERGIDDERVYERLAAHWYRVSKRPVEPSTAGLSPADRQRAEGLSAHYSFLALQHLAGERSTDVSRQKALVYVTHLRKYFQQHRQLADELAVVRIHRSLEPGDWLLQLDEVELLYLTQAVADADRRLTQVEQELSETAAPTQVRRRLAAARRMGARIGLAAPAADWPRGTGDPAATLEGPTLRWITGGEGGLELLWERLWREFARDGGANPCGQ